MESTQQQKRELTQSQLLLWAGQKLSPDKPLHNTVHTFEIAGMVDHSIFSRAFQETINCTDAMRIVFLEEDNTPFQYSRPKVDFIPELIDLTSESDEKVIEEIIQRRGRIPLDIGTRIFDAALFKIDEDRYLWFLNMHHLVTDAISATIVYKRLVGIYGKMEKNEWDRPAESPSFFEYVDYEQRTRLDKHDERSGTYWEEKIKTVTGTPDFYGVKRKDSITDATRVSIPLGHERTQKLKRLAQKPEVRAWTANLTMFNLLATVFFTYLHRISGQKRIAVGAPTHNRLNKRSHDTVGAFIEIFPLIIAFSEEDTFDSILQRIRIETNEYLRYAQPGGVTPAISGSFNCILNFINASFSDFNGLPIKSQWIPTGHIDITHQIRCHVVDFDNKGDMELLFDLNHGTFGPDLIGKVPQHFLNLLDAFLEDMGQSIHAPGMATATELEQIMHKDSGNVGSATVLDLFKEQVGANPGAPAIRFKEDTINYGQLDQKSDRLAHYLLECGAKKNDRIGLYMERSPKYLIGVLAILKIGGTFIPIPSNQPKQRINYILKDAAVTVLLTSTTLKSDISGSAATLVVFDTIDWDSTAQTNDLPNVVGDATGIAYILYTSGSTGNPKGVLIPHSALSNYIHWAKKAYANSEKYIFPLFTSIGFDLTITSTFLPLVTGGEVVVYKESAHGPDISLMDVFEQNRVTSIKLTPSHLNLIREKDVSNSKIKTMIVGGEDFKTQLAKTVQNNFGDHLRIYNEYGPTEATVGCIVGLFDVEKHDQTSVPIGRTIDGMEAYILDSHKNMVPHGVVGELYLGGMGLASGYANLSELTSERFVDHPFDGTKKLYYTGDLARINQDGEYEYLGRSDEQVKLRGFRIELTDIEANMEKHPAVESAAVVLMERKKTIPEEEILNCVECGLPSNYPNADFDENGVCHVCNAFEEYRDRALRYFKTEEDLKKILLDPNLDKDREYDCLSLLSGGKDSTYILAQLKRMGLKVLAFTLDNGYISDQAKDNIDNIVSKMGIDHVYGTTEHMNKIFVDSLHRHQNVCNGCFKTIYTLSTKIALEKKIPFVVTGLSRGQFYETRLTEELFWKEDTDVARIDETILEARKLYHQEEDAAKALLDTDMFKDDETFQKVRFIDFYRYTDVSLEEMIKVLENDIGWRRPTDTGRSTNCLINQLGIYVHKKQKGYSNYSYPYSWDVRMGHKTRQETLDEINEYIHEDEVLRMMKEIGYEEPGETELGQEHLVAYYTGASPMPSIEMAEYLKKGLPDYMVPRYIKHVEQFPLTTNGKVDKNSLKQLNTDQLNLETPYVAPKGEIEELIAVIWKEVLQLNKVGTEDNFIALGGHSLAAIRVTARINEEFQLNVPLNKIFELPTIASYAKYIEETILTLLEES
ncbi:hypothetical protein FGF1_02350 [Flavobacteriaceae bacterium GF1]